MFAPIVGQNSDRESRHSEYQIYELRPRKEIQTHLTERYELDSTFQIQVASTYPVLDYHAYKTIVVCIDDRRGVHICSSCAISAAI